MHSIGVAICGIEHSELGFRIPQMAWRVAEEGTNQDRAMAFSVLCPLNNGQVHAHIQGCTQQHRSRPVVKTIGATQIPT
jgi:hypothetical protein